MTFTPSPNDLARILHAERPLESEGRVATVLLVVCMVIGGTFLAWFAMNVRAWLGAWG